MSVRRVDPGEAAELLGNGWKYIDVRSIPEFERGHPSGAYNVPLLHLVPGRGMAPNPEFGAVMAAQFGRDERLVIGCKTGNRSLRAAEMLAAAGYTNVVDMRGGFMGETDPTGQVTPGWSARSLPVASVAEPGKSYDELRAAKK
jgi:rhodanese-related sulfurtransferase